MQIFEIKAFSVESAHFQGPRYINYVNRVVHVILSELSYKSF